MARLNEPIWTFLKGYFVSTNDTYDCGLETMVFPASVDARTIKGFFYTTVVGVDFEKPFDEYTRHYRTVEEAKAGHKETVHLLSELLKEAEHAEN